MLDDLRQRCPEAPLRHRGGLEIGSVGRSVADSIKGIQELDSLGIKFLAVTQNIGIEESSPMSRFMLVIMSAFAELERELIRERTVAGVRAAKANGKTLGRPRRVFRRDEAIRLRQPGQKQHWYPDGSRMRLSEPLRATG